MSISIRKSTNNDLAKIYDLSTACFGCVARKKVLDSSLTDRYLLLFDDDNLVAMTGLYTKSEFNALEIDWTCTDPKYRNKGYMHMLFEELLKNVKEPVYCSAWRLSGFDAPNLHTILTDFNFIKVIKNRVTYAVPHNCFRFSVEDCVYYKELNCTCSEDLYLRSQ